jgi:hypothetical protein
MIQTKTVITGNPCSITLDAAPGEGDLLVWSQGWRIASLPVPSVPTGFTYIDGDQTTIGGAAIMAYRIVQAGDPAGPWTCTNNGSTSSVITLTEYSGAWPSNPVDVQSVTHGDFSVHPSWLIAPTAGINGIIVAGAVNSNGNTPQDHDYVAGSGWTLLGQSGQDDAHNGSPVSGTIQQIIDPAAGTYNPNLTCSPGFPFDGSTSYWAAVAVSFRQSADSVTPPTTGQPVGPETITMSGADGTTAFRFADGTLQVFVDNTDQTGAILTSDGAAGTFTLDFTPWPGEIVTAYYKGI